MISWIKLDLDKPPIQNTSYLISDGNNVDVAHYDDIWFVPDLSQIDGSNAITHYAKINLPTD